MGKTIIEMDPKYAYISCGVDKKDKKAIMDDFRIRHAIDWLKQNRTTFLDDGECDGEWSFPTSGNGEKGGFGTVFTVSNTNNKTYAIKLASLVQLLDLGNCEIDDDKQALERGKNYYERKLEKLKSITANEKESPNLCKIYDFEFIPYGKGIPDASKYSGSYSRVQSDYIICIKMESLQKLDFVRDFCDEKRVFDELLLIKFGIDMCNSLKQLKGFYHRDIHPGNFMLSNDESRTLKLIDYDTVLETDKNTTYLDYNYKVKRDDLALELNYKSSDAVGRYDIYDDICSGGRVLYDIANYDYEKGTYNARRYSEQGILECDVISKDLLEVIRKACVNNCTYRYSDWDEFKEALLGIRDFWRKYRLISQIPGVCNEWISRKSGNDAESVIMRVIKADDHDLKEEYENRYKVLSKVKLADTHFPELIEETERNDSVFLIEKQPPKMTLRSYLKELRNDEEHNADKHYAFICQFLKKYVQLLSTSISAYPFRQKRLAKYRNLITSENTFISNRGDLWISGLLMPKDEYKYYLDKDNGNNYLLETYDDENNEYTAVYVLGVLLNEMLTGDTKVNVVKPKSKINISDKKNGALLDLMSACLAAYENREKIERIALIINNL